MGAAVTIATASNTSLTANACVTAIQFYTALNIIVKPIVNNLLLVSFGISRKKANQRAQNIFSFTEICF